MEFLKLIQDNWFILLQSVGIIAGLFFTGWSLRLDAKVRRVANGFELTKQHREIWTHLYSRPELKRVVNPAANLAAQPVTEEEELFVNFLLLHLASAYRAMKNGMFILPDELHADVTAFLSLPVPKVVWEMSKHYRNRDFVVWVEQQNQRRMPSGK